MSREQEPELQLEHGFSGELASEGSLAELHRQIGDIMLMYAPMRTIERSLPHDNPEGGEFSESRMDLKTMMLMKGERRAVTLKWPFVQEDGGHNYYYLALSAQSGWRETEEGEIVADLEEELEWDGIEVDADLDDDQALHLLTQVISDETAPAAQKTLARYFYNVLRDINEDREVTDEDVFYATSNPLDVWNMVEKQLDKDEAIAELTCELAVTLDDSPPIVIKANDLSGAGHHFGNDPLYRHVTLQTSLYEYTFTDAPGEITNDFNTLMDDELELLTTQDEPVSPEEEQDNPYDIVAVYEDEESDEPTQFFLAFEDPTLAPRDPQSFTNREEALAYRTRLHRALRIKERNAQDLTEEHAIAVIGLLELIEAGRAKHLQITETP